MKKLIIVIFGFAFAFFILNSLLIESYQSTTFPDMTLKNHPLYSNSASCGEWNLQTNGCYERVCCCDEKGHYWCERCCPDSSGKCTPYRVNC